MTLCKCRTFSLGLEFIETNLDADKWFVQIETFDPHEPFFSHEEFKALCAYPTTLASPRLELCLSALRCAVPSF